MMPKATDNLDLLFENSYQIEQALKQLMDPRYADGIARVKEVLEAAVSHRDRIKSLENSVALVKQKHDTLMAEVEAAQKALEALQRQKSEVEGQIATAKGTLATIRAEARRLAGIV
jgi:chromosome segregation ATPase